MFWAMSDETFKKVHQLPDDVKRDVYIVCFLLLSCCFVNNFLLVLIMDVLSDYYIPLGLSFCNMKKICGYCFAPFIRFSYLGSK